MQKRILEVEVFEKSIRCGKLKKRDGQRREWMESVRYSLRYIILVLLVRYYTGTTGGLYTGWWVSNLPWRYLVISYIPSLKLESLVCDSIWASRIRSIPYFPSIFNIFVCIKKTKTLRTTVRSISSKNRLCKLAVYLYTYLDIYFGHLVRTFPQILMLCVCLCVRFFLCVCDDSALLTKFFAEALFRTSALECLTEIAGLVDLDPRYNPLQQQMFVVLVKQVSFFF